MRIEAITVCCGYGDLLAVTVQENQSLLDDLVVVTTEDDQETIDVCRRFSLHYIATDDHKRGGPFNKARLIQRAFGQISASDWVLHLDADVVLPRRFRDLLEWADLQQECIYGFDRCNVVGWDAWQKLKHEKGGWDNHRFGNYLTLRDHVGSRWVSHLHGWCPIGFAQLLHGSALLDRGMHQKVYRYHHGSAERTDVQFSLQWDRKHRVLLPEVVVLHLESEAAAMGANWRGRTTKRFGPEWANAKAGPARDRSVS